jgi:hypothetical protein
MTAFLRWQLRLCLFNLPKDFVIVPREPTYTMERAYFTAEMPKYSVNAAGRLKRSRNKTKMTNRWNAMVGAGEVVTKRKANTHG